MVICYCFIHYNQTSYSIISIGLVWNTLAAARITGLALLGQVEAIPYMYEKEGFTVKLKNSLVLDYTDIKLVINLYSFIVLNLC